MLPIHVTDIFLPPGPLSFSSFFLLAVSSLTARSGLFLTKLGSFVSLSASFNIPRIVLLSRMSGVCWRRISRQEGAGSARDDEQVQQNRYMLQVKAS